MEVQETELQKLPVSGPGGLREKARERATQLGMETGWVATANKETCIKFILSGSKPEQQQEIPLPKPEPQHQPEAQSPPRRGGLEDLIIDGVLQRIDINKLVPEDRLAEMVRRYATSPTIKVRVAEKPEVEMPRQHYKFPLILAAAANRIPVLLVGGAGSGKTTVAFNVAKALNLPFYAIAGSKDTPKGEFLGTFDAHGKYRETDTTKAYGGGGVLLADELDNLSGSGGVALNMFLANDRVSTRNGVLQRHENFVFIGGANTYGTGASALYVGRSQLDAATLDRFFVITFDYDWGLTAHVHGVSHPSPKFSLGEGGTMTSDEWLAYVKAVNAAIEKLKLRHIVGPRAFIIGSTLLKAGVGRTHVEDGLLWKGLDETAVKKIKELVKA